MDKEKYILLAKKLKALAEQGVGWEAENAKRQLEALIKRHGLQEEEVEAGESMVERIFEVPRTGYNRKLAYQLIYTICGKRETFTSYGKTRIFVKMTEAEYVDFTTRYPVYKKSLTAHLKQALEIAYTSFLYANNLFPKWGQSWKPKIDFSPEELDIIKKALRQQPEPTIVFNSLPAWKPQLK